MVPAFLFRSVRTVTDYLCHAALLELLSHVRGMIFRVEYEDVAG